MPQSVVVLYLVYAMELLSMIVAMGYVACLFMQKQMVFNEHLKGNRLKAGAVLPVIWFVYVFTDAYVVFKAGQGISWRLPDYAIWTKIIMQVLSLIGGLLLALFVMGYKFGDK